MSIVLTRLQEYRAASPEASKYTTRTTRAGAFDCYALGNSELGSIVTQDMLDEAAASAGRDIKIPVFDSESISITSGTRPVSISDSENTTALMSVTKNVYSWGFTMTPAQYMNNEIKYRQDWQRKFKKYLDALIVQLETDALTELNTNKNQPYSELLVHTEVSDTITSTDANKDRLLGDLSVIMNAHDFYSDKLRIVGNPGVQGFIRQQEKYGQLNQENKTLEYLDKTLHFTNQLSNAVGYQATGYAINPGSLGLLFTHEPDAIMRTRLGESTEFDTAMVPVLNIPMSTYYYESREDQSAIAGAASSHLTRAGVENFGFSIEIAFITAYNDDLVNNASPIMKFQVADPV